MSFALSRVYILAITTITLVAVTTSSAGAENKSEVKESAAADKQTHLLRYRFRVGEHVRTKVIHQAAVKTTIDGTTQKAETVSISLKVWHVTDIDEDGNISFVHSVDYVDMKNDVTGRATVRFDSRTDQKAPPGFENVANRVGVPLTKVVMDPTGQIVSREDLAPGTQQASQLTLPLPKKKVAVGDTWTFPADIKVHLRSGEGRTIKARQRFELQKVDRGIATIHVATQILSPVNNKEIEAQLVQRESEGIVRFDIAAGRVIGQQIDLDRRVVGYPNDKSSMHYRTRFTEKLVTSSERTAAKPE